MNIIKLLSSVDLSSQMTAIHKLKEVGSGISGELFEVVVCFALEAADPTIRAHHVGMLMPDRFKGIVDSKADIVIECTDTSLYPISLKTSKKSTKIYQGNTSDVLLLHQTKLYKKEDLGTIIAGKLGVCSIISAVFDDETWKIEHKNFDDARTNLTSGNFTVKSNKNSISLTIPEGRRLSVYKDGRILAHNDFFTVTDSLSGLIKPMDPYSLLKGVINYIDEAI